MICDIAKTIAKIAAKAPAIVLKIAVTGSSRKSSALKLMLYLVKQE